MNNEIAYTSNEISQILGISVSQVNKRAKKCGIDMIAGNQTKRTMFSQQQFEKIKSLGKRKNYTFKIIERLLKDSFWQFAVLPSKLNFVDDVDDL